MCRAIVSVAALTLVLWPFCVGFVIGVNKLRIALHHKREAKK